MSSQKRQRPASPTPDNRPYGPRRPNSQASIASSNPDARFYQGTNASQHRRLEEQPRVLVMSERTVSNLSTPAPAPNQSRNNQASDRAAQNGAPWEADEEMFREIIMSVNITDRGSVGCAYYIAAEEKMYLMEDLQLGGSDVLDILKHYIDPTTIIASFRCPEDAMRHLDPNLGRQDLTAHGSHSDQTRLPYLLQLRPNGEFKYEPAVEKIACLQLTDTGEEAITYVTPTDMFGYEDLGIPANDEHNAGHQGQILRLSAYTNFESRLSIGCAGALLLYLHRRRTAQLLQGDSDASLIFRVAAVQMFGLKDTMLVNADTVASLQITALDSHPNMQHQGPAGKNWSRGAKEGLSIYGMFHHLAKTSQGRVALRRLFLRPSIDIDLINERLNTTEALLRMENCAVFEELSTDIKHIKNIQLSLVQLRKGIANGAQRGLRSATAIWSSLRQFCLSSIKITETICQLQDANSLPTRLKFIHTVDKRILAGVGSLVSSVVDFDVSKDQGRTVVQPALDAELDEARRLYAGIEDLLSKVATHVAGTLPTHLDLSLNVIFFPQIGFLIAVSSESPRTNDGVLNLENDPWEEVFSTETHRYYKNAIMLELDNEYGDVYGQISDREIEILHDLAQRVLEHETLLKETSRLCGELDSMLALAQGARLYGLVRPQMTEQNVIRIKNGRHPLQELTVQAFVPNDTYIKGGVGDGQEDISHDHNDNYNHPVQLRTLDSPDNEASMLLMTGPNYSGKSVYLKQVAVIVYMAHVGCFVPAEAAEIGITDMIITRIVTRETVSRERGAFMIDLQQIAMALNLATRRSLIVIDEFGKGTESYDGAGLATGVFQHLLDRGVHSPKVIAATHFHEIFECNLLPPQPGLALGHMEVAVDESASSIEDQLTYLYTYRPGRSISSFGTVCAAMNGVAQEVVLRAEQLIQISARGEDLVEACSELPEAELADLQVAEHIAREFLATDSFDSPRQIIADLLGGDLAS